MSYQDIENLSVNQNECQRIVYKFDEFMKPRVYLPLCFCVTPLLMIMAMIAIYNFLMGL